MPTIHAPTRALGLLPRASIVALCAAAAAAAAGPLNIDHCVAGPPIHLAEAGDKAMLDNVEREQVNVAILARYPALAADGFAPQQIMLWRRGSDGWLFTSLMPTPDHPETPCFTATFEANLFDITPTLTQKYFFAGRTRT